MTAGMVGVPTSRRMSHGVKAPTPRASGSGQAGEMKMKSSPNPNENLRSIE